MRPITPKIEQHGDTIRICNGKAIIEQVAEALIARGLETADEAADQLPLRQERFVERVAEAVWDYIMYDLAADSADWHYILTGKRVYRPAGEYQAARKARYELQPGEYAQRARELLLEGLERRMREEEQA